MAAFDSVIVIVPALGAVASTRRASSCATQISASLDVAVFAPVAPRPPE